MKKFLVFVMIAVVALGIGFATFRFTVKQQVIRVDTTPVECNEGDTFALDIEIRNKKNGTTITATSSNTDIVALSNTAGEEYKFEAKSGGVATITVTSNVSGFVSQEIKVTVGDGSSENLPLCISSVEQYNKIGRDSVYTLNKCYKLVSDLSFNGNYQVLGNFSGTFDFANHRMSDIAIEANDASNFGLFASLSKEAVVKNLVLTDFAAKGAEKTGKINIGAVAGINNGIIRDVKILKATIDDGSSEAYLGGVAGTNNGSIKRVQADLVIINKNETSIVGANSIVGGIAGLNSSALASIYACSVSPNIAGGLYVGGVAGQNDSATIENCAVGALDSNFEVSANADSTFVGGLVGYNLCKSARASVVDSYALVNLGTKGNRGAIVAKNQNDMIEGTQFENPIFGCYYNQELTGTGINSIYATVDKNGNSYEYSNKSYIKYISAKTTEQLTETQDTYVSYVENEENVLWRFDSVWFFAAGSVPTLNLDSTAGSNRVSLFIAVNGNPGEINTDKAGDEFDENTNYKITKDITVTSPIIKYNAVLEGVKKADGNYPTVTFAYSNFTGDWAALIGTLGTNGHIKNLNFKVTISGVTANTVTYYANLVAHNNGDINNCTIDSGSLIAVTKVPEKSIYVGGIVAENKGQVVNSNQLGAISVKSVSTVESYVGGIAARHFEDANISNVKTGTLAISVEKTFIGYVGGIVGLSSSNIANAKNYSQVAVLASSDDRATAVGGVVGKVEGRNIRIYQSANFANITSKNVGGVVGILENSGNSSNSDIQVNECMSQGTLGGLRVGGIVYVANCGLIKNNLSQNHIIGATGEEDSSVVAGLVYKLNVNKDGIVRAYNCVANCTFGNAGRKFYEDANAVVFGRGNKASTLRGGYYGNPLSVYGTVDVYALTNCYAINKNDKSVERTNGWSYQEQDYFWQSINLTGADIAAKSDHFIDMGNSDAIQTMKTANTEKVIHYETYVAFIHTETKAETITVEPFDASIWTIGVGNIALNAFVD